MKKIGKIIPILGILAVLFSFIKNTPSGEVTIGSQTWTNTNLDVSTFRNGDAIQEAKTPDEWKNAGEEKKPAWCYYHYDQANETNYGKLYNWFAVSDPRGLAPKGWHIPSDAEWKTLIDFLGGESIAGGKLRSPAEWKGGGNGTNESGFNGLPGGRCHIDGSFGRGSVDDMGYFGSWWSSTEFLSNSGWRLQIDSRSLQIYVNDKVEGLSVRCIKD
jgi:uncharacterized protein (TIGR02145 family)